LEVFRAEKGILGFREKRDGFYVQYDFSQVVRILSLFKKKVATHASPNFPFILLG
jgi:hypothetical protein